MKVKLLIIGDEVLSGQVSDLNTKNAAIILKQAGISLSSVEIVSDERNILTKKLEEGLKDYDLVITSGGLGPTKDDHSKYALCEMLKTTLKDNQRARELVTNQYERIEKQWKPNYNSYHLIPEMVTPLANPAGLAPGLFYKESDKFLLMAPGVPREFEFMLRDVFIPLIKNHPLYRKENKKYLYFKTFGFPEEKIFNELCPDLWSFLEDFGDVGSYPQTRNLGVDIILNLKESHGDITANELIQHPSFNALRDTIWSTEDETLEEAIIKRATKKNVTISTAESCTGGLIGHKLTSVSGSSQVYLGGVISYANSVKTSQLNVDEELIKNHGAVSEEVALEMAKGVKELLKSDLSLSTSGIAGPLGGSEEKPVGTLTIGLSSFSKSKSERKRFYGDRDLLKQRFSSYALHKLREMIDLN